MDSERVPALIARLELALAKLELINEKARGLGDARPLGDDGYSAIAAQRISRQASDDEGCHGSANLAYQEAVRNGIANLRAQVASVQQVDEDNASGWQGA